MTIQRTLCVMLSLLLFVSSASAATPRVKGAKEGNDDATPRQLRDSISDLTRGGAGNKKDRKGGKKRSNPLTGKGGRGKGKSGREVCLVSGMIFEPTGPSDPVDGPTGAGPMGACLLALTPLLNACFGPAIPPVDPTMEEVEAYQECLSENGVFDEPWWYNRDVFGTFSFDPEANPNTNDDGAFKGEIAANADAVAKVTMEYFSTELQDSPVSKLTSIGFQYNIEQCASATCTCANPATLCNTDSCENEIYLNVYVRQDAMDTGFYGCKYDFTARNFGTGDGVVVGDWQDFSINLDSTPERVCGQFVDGGTPSCAPSTGLCPTTLRGAADAGYVLSTKSVDRPGCDIGSAFMINIGDTACQDGGMIAYIDNVLVTYDFESGQDAHLYNMVSPDL